MVFIVRVTDTVLETEWMPISPEAVWRPALRFDDQDGRRVIDAFLA
jgi:hypothetical protein